MRTSAETIGGASHTTRGAVRPWLTALLSTLALAACASKPPDSRVPEADARQAALAAVPGAQVKDHELEEEGGRWIYSYDLTVPGRSGVEEIHVDAKTGEVVAREHESEADEADEAATEAEETGEADENGVSWVTPAPLTEPYDPAISASDFVRRVDNPYFPLVPGTVYHYESTSGETGTVTVTRQTRDIAGIAATVVLDQVFEDGNLAEETLDWYAQDEAGNVWYLGEDSREMDGGDVVSTAGSWEAWKDGARPGLVMPAEPTPGQAYRQEYRRGEAEDQGRVEAVRVSATVPYGSFEDCVRTADTSPLEPSVHETKLYCRGVGLIEENEGPRSINRLVNIEQP